MPYKLAFIFILLSLVSCQYEKSLDTLYYDCLVDGFNSKGIDIENQVIEYEKILIENKILESSAGQSYHDFYQKITEGKKIPFLKSDYEFAKTELNAFGKNGIKECMSELVRTDSISSNPSKNYKLKIAFERLVDEGNISTSSVAKEINGILVPGDFETDLYRLKALLSISMIIETEKGIQSILPPINTDSN